MPKAAREHRNYKPYAYAGILFIVLHTPAAILQLTREFTELSHHWVLAYISVIALYVTAYLFFMWGFKELGETDGSKLLARTAVALMALTVLAALYDFFLLTHALPEPLELVINIVGSIVTGILGVLFGISCYRLQQKYGGLARAVGILNIISGVFYLSFVLMPLVILLVIPGAIVEIMLFFRASR